MKKSIIYFGTPEFAVTPLKKLIEQQYNVVAVVTVPDKPSGRGLKMQNSPVKEFALQYSLPVLQPDNLTDTNFINELIKLEGELFIVVAFRKLPKVVWSLPKAGCYNLHSSLLPQYRGAAPINHAIINGEETTGVTTFFLDEKIDTGKIILQKELTIGPDETAGELHDRLMLLGADAVIETTNAIFNNNYSLKDQNSLISPTTISENESDTILKKAPKIFREDCMINWGHDAGTIHNFIRGLSPYPGAFSTLYHQDGQIETKVLKSARTQLQANGVPGSIILSKDKMLVSTQDEMLALEIIQPAGKKVMHVNEFLRGNRSVLTKFNT